MDSIFDIGLKKVQKISSSLDGSQDIKEVKKFSKKIIGLYGSAGGVGVTSFIEELAIIFANHNYNILIIDGNFLFPRHKLYYNAPENTASFTEILDMPTNHLFNIVKKSNISPKISYVHQNNIELLNLIKLEEDFANYNKVQDKLEEYRKMYDVILIDLCLPLLNTGLEQALLKSCEYLINIKTPDISCLLNKEALDKLILLTAKNNIKILTIENKVKETNKELLYLPYEEYFSEVYDAAKSFLVSGKSDSDLYIEQFEIIYESCIKDLYQED